MNEDIMIRVPTIPRYLPTEQNPISEANNQLELLEVEVI